MCILLVLVPLMFVEIGQCQTISSSLKFFILGSWLWEILSVMFSRSSLYHITSYLQGELCLALALPSPVISDTHFSGNYFLVYNPPRICLLPGCQLYTSYTMICHTWTRPIPVEQFNGSEIPFSGVTFLGGGVGSGLPWEPMSLESFTMDHLCYQYFLASLSPGPNTNM